MTKCFSPSQIQLCFVIGFCKSARIFTIGQELPIESLNAVVLVFYIFMSTCSLSFCCFCMVSIN